MTTKRTVKVLINNENILYAIGLKDIAEQKKYFLEQRMKIECHQGICGYELPTITEARKDFNNYFKQIEISWDAYKAFRNDNKNLFFELTGYYLE